jgi:dipeptidyl aminopeptidase/acylaminoacyl peptidase
LFNTRTTEFKALISHCGVFNFESMIATEEQWFYHWEFGGAPWETRAQTRRFSPHRHAEKMRTPTLVIHNDHDFRVPVSEGLQLFNTLQLLGIDSRMLNFPDEGHWVLKPANSVLWHEQVFDWLERYIGPASQPLLGD